MEDSMGSSRVVIRSFAGKKEPVSSPNSDDSGWEDDKGVRGVGSWQKSKVADRTFESQKGDDVMGIFKVLTHVIKVSLSSSQIFSSFPNNVGNYSVAAESEEAPSQCNNRFLGDMKSFVSRKVWEFALKLGIQVRVVKRSMLRRLEEWKKEINKGNKEVESYELRAKGVSGGIIILWRKNLLCLNSSFRGRGYVGVNAMWKCEYNLVNIYSPYNAADKKRLWSSLICKKRNRGGGGWIVGGDFNSILNRKERLGVDDYMRKCQTSITSSKGWN
ncbi:hypothetical protein KIW84_013638 [Lathyrus oleraceus]|uniref:Uncharacterized protein n=1 Tax=Pisum sativum TaxID=3888 RepID=A0A9D5BKX9_PEA|nr:hypothetical protein KIW84_013638 [Pisum sativum]